MKKMDGEKKRGIYKKCKVNGREKLAYVNLDE
jgi:hypothetical protein